MLEHIPKLLLSGFFIAEEFMAQSLFMDSIQMLGEFLMAAV